jgi:hypothetical protein
MSDETKKPAGKRAKSSTARGARRKVNVPTDEDARRLLVQLDEARINAVANKIMDELGARYAAAVAAGKRDPRYLVFNGWSGLADALGAPRDVQIYCMLEEVLHRGSRTSWELPGEKGIGLWTYGVSQGSEPGHPETLVVIISDALVPAAVAATNPRKAAGRAGEAPASQWNTEDD